MKKKIFLFCLEILNILNIPFNWSERARLQSEIRRKKAFLGKCIEKIMIKNKDETNGCGCRDMTLLLITILSFSGFEIDIWFWYKKSGGKDMKNKQNTIIKSSRNIYWGIWSNRKYKVGEEYTGKQTWCAHPFIPGSTLLLF